MVQVALLCTHFVKDIFNNFRRLKALLIHFILLPIAYKLLKLNNLDTKTPLTRQQRETNSSKSIVARYDLDYCLQPIVNLKNN